MFLVYDENQPRKAGGFRSLADANATAFYLYHFNNLMYLDFLAKKSDIFAERAQAEKELIICRRKLAFWEKHPNYDQDVVTAKVEKLKRSYSGERKSGA